MQQTCLSPTPGYQQGRPPEPGLGTLVRRCCSREPATTAELVVAARGGSQEAFAELHRRYHRVVESVVRAETRHEGDVADLVQEAFARAWMRLGSLSDPDRFRAWLLQIARHQVIDHGRMMNRRPVVEEPAAGEGYETRLERLASPEPGPVEQALLSDLAERLRVAIDGLSRRDAIAVSLVVELGFGPDDLGAALGISPGNARVVLHRARHRLRHLAGE